MRNISIVVILLLLAACATRKKLESRDVIYKSPTFNSKLVLWDDGSYTFSARNIGRAFKSDYVSQGTWEARNNLIVLNSFNQPRDYNNLVVAESVSGSPDSVYFNYFLVDSNLESHTLDTTTYVLSGIWSIEPNNKGENLFFKRNTLQSGFA